MVVVTRAWSLTRAVARRASTVVLLFWLEGNVGNFCTIWKFLPFPGSLCMVLVVFCDNMASMNLYTSVAFVSSTQMNNRNVSTCFSGEIGCLLLVYFPTGILPMFIISLHKIENDFEAHSYRNLLVQNSLRQKICVKPYFLKEHSPPLSLNPESRALTIRTPTDISWKLTITWNYFAVNINTT